VLIAAVFLAIIGGSAGWIIGGRAKAADEQRLAEQNAPQGGPEAPADGQQPGDGGTDGGTGEQGGGSDGGGAGEGLNPDRCPPHTRRLAARYGAAGQLKVQLYLRASKSHVWICVDGRGTLFYQGFNGGRGQPMSEGDNALFLTRVQERDDGYLATNEVGDRTTTYLVTKERLVITHGDGRREIQPAA
jgi:hypothetical protein